MVDWWVREIDRLLRENAKLREFAEEMVQSLRLAMEAYDERNGYAKHDYDDACNGLALYDDVDKSLRRYEKENEHDA